MNLWDSQSVTGVGEGPTLSMGIRESRKPQTAHAPASVAQSDAAFRVCPGQKFADANVFLVTASVLATMNIFSPDPADAVRGVSCDDFASGLTR